ncbi:MAG TPA: asparagine synthase (glutamine-hydrolyzing), partial [Isosphaeraceae bacterium]
GVALGARRLSVVDLENGRQPIDNEDGTVWVAYNGELYQYPEVRKDLLARGHTLKTRCDTEAWVHLYEDFGEGMFEKARGDFAVAVWDRKTRTLILGRDRAGVCPLYYAERDGWLLFGSEVKALLASGLVANVPDPKGIDYFFNFFSAGTTRTFFEGVKSIPPGHFLRIREGRVELRKYWDLDFPDAGQERRLKDPTPLVDELLERLQQGVERRLHSDVPVVSYISGGLDSTVVLGLTKRLQGHAMPSFTARLDGSGPDEGSKSHQSATALGSPLTTVRMTHADIANAFPETIEAAEGPVLDTSAACMIRLAQEVHRQGYKVVLTGEGADEGLAGYLWFKTQKVMGIARKLGLNGAMKLLRRRWAGTKSGGLRVAPPLRGFGGVRPGQQEVYELIGRSRGIVYSPTMWDALGDHSAYDDVDITNDRIGKWAPLNQSLYVAYRVMLAGMLMIAKGDRAARHSGVEGRYPFLDDDVISFCASIAPEYKLRGFTDKWLLRRVAKKILPPEIADRKKTMFTAHWSATFLGPERPAWVDQLLSPESLARSGYFDAAGVARARGRLPELGRISPKRLIYDAGLTSVITTQLWHHLYCGGGLCELPAWSPPALTPEPAPEVALTTA